MSLPIQAFFSGAQTGVGYQFYDVAGALLGSRVTAGISTLPGTGGYAADATVPATAVGVYWSTDTTFAREDLRDAIALDAVAASVRTELATELARLDVAVSTRNATTPPTAVAISDQVWTEPVADHSGTTGATAAALAAIKTKTDRIAADITIVSAVSIDGGTITARRGDTWELDLDGLGDLTSRSGLVFAIKRSISEPDDDAQVLVDLTGLQRLNRAAHGTAADGSITVDNAAAGDITVVVKGGATLELSPQEAVWAVKLIESDGTATTLTTGTFNITHAAIRQTTA